MVRDTEPDLFLCGCYKMILRYCNGARIFLSSFCLDNTPLGTPFIVGQRKELLNHSTQCLILRARAIVSRREPVSRTTGFLILSRQKETKPNLNDINGKNPLLPFLSGPRLPSNKGAGLSILPRFVEHVCGGGYPNSRTELWRTCA